MNEKPGVERDILMEEAFRLHELALGKRPPERRTFFDDDPPTDE
jgi:hypothetical protein